MFFKDIYHEKIMKDSARKAMFAKGKSNYIHNDKEWSFGNPRIIDKSQSFRDAQGMNFAKKKLGRKLTIDESEAVRYLSDKNWQSEDDISGSGGVNNIYNVMARLHHFNVVDMKYDKTDTLKEFPKFKLKDN